MEQCIATLYGLHQSISINMLERAPGCNILLLHATNGSTGIIGILLRAGYHLRGYCPWQREK